MAAPQHPLWLSVLLHLSPGPPLELGYLLWHARRTTGSFRLGPGTVGYRRRRPQARLAIWAVGLVAHVTIKFLLSLVAVVAGAAA